MKTQPEQTVFNESDKNTPATPELRTHPGDEVFYRYLYKHSLREKGYVLLILSAFNLILLIPDLLLVKSIVLIVLISLFRIVLTAVLVLFFMRLDRIRNFPVYARILTAIEIYGIFVFLFVLLCYPKPDLLIQSLGMILILYLLFMFPCNWNHTVAVSFVAICSFILIVSFRITDLTPMRLAALFVYLAVATILSAYGARGNEQYRLRHYAALEAFRALSTTDTLTKTYNRVRFEHDGEKWIQLCRTHLKPLSLAFIDLDNLKSINDAHGHLVGDKILIETASRIRRQIDSRDILCRWGGDEFVVLLPGVDLTGAVHIVEKIREAVTGEAFVGGIVATCSFGVTSMEKDSTLRSLLYNADQLMYEAKRKGRNRIEY